MPAETISPATNGGHPREISTKEDGGEHAMHGAGGQFRGYGLVETAVDMEVPTSRSHTDIVNMIHRAEHDVVEYAKNEAEVLLRRISLGGAEFDLVGGVPDLQRMPLLEERKAEGQEERGPRKDHQQSVGLAALAFSRSMIGTAVLYLPRMFYTGGLGFSTIVLVFVAITSTYNMVLLSHVHDKFDAHSFGGLGRLAFGSFGQYLVNGIICFTQVLWTSGYLLFVQSNLTEAIPGLESALHLPPRWGLLVLQLVILIPLSWVRRLTYLSAANFCANVCVMLGLFICLGYSSSVLFEHGGPAPFKWWNSNDCALMLGSVAITFEGMSLTLPIKRSMRKPHLFAPMVCISMTGLCILFWSVGAAGYLAFGDAKVATFATNNLPKHGVLGPTVRVAYSLAVLLTYPLQLFPALVLLERSVFYNSSLPPTNRKILKNIFRSMVVIFTCFIAIYMGKRFDNFAALIGALGSVPLALILAPAIHLKLCYKEIPPARRVLEISIMGLGVAAMVLSFIVTMVTWAP